MRKLHAPSLIALAPRQVRSRASLAALGGASLILMVLSQAGSPATVRLRTGILDSLSPVISFVSAPVSGVAGIGNWLGDMARLRSENIALKNTNLQLLQWQAAAKSMEAENNSLRALLNVVPAKKNHYVTARIVSDMGGPYVRSALIGGGSEQGILKDQAVINEQGLVGRVIDAGKQNSRVLLLNDMNSRVPVIGETSREKTILVGNNTDLPHLSYLSADSAIKVGERIITSGDGGIFPRGIAVGVVTSIDKGVVRVQPFVDASSIEYVSVVDYSL